jgi:hypothetical protein
MGAAVDVVGSLDNVMLRNEVASLKMRVGTLETKLQHVMQSMQMHMAGPGPGIIGMRPQDMYNDYIVTNTPVMRASPPTSPQGGMYMDPGALPMVPRECYT